MRSVVFSTDGHIPIESFTTFGLNAKPRTQSPIGFFGTGLKYAVSVLVRSGATFEVWIGLNKHTFYVKKEDFRGKEFGFIAMRRDRYDMMDRISRKPREHKLPFTTEYGKNWELWQAFRELESNTIDENGETYLIDAACIPSSSAESGDRWTRVDNGECVTPSPDKTLIIVGSEKFVDEFHSRERTFLPGSLTQRECSRAAEILETSSQHIYYRGLRVADVQKPAMFTYNVLSSLELTEDRTVKYDHQVEMAVAETVALSNDEALIEKILTAPKESWEHDLKFDFIEMPPSEAFKRVASRRREAINRSAGSYYGGYGGGYIAEKTSWQLFPLPWSATVEGVFDCMGRLIFRPNYGLDPGQFKQLCQDVVDLVNESKEVQHQDSSEPAIEPEVEPPASTSSVENDIPF